MAQRKNPETSRRIPSRVIDQAGVIPYRIRNQEVQVLLITSRTSGRWIIPKGLIDPGMTPEEAALQEAHEEAGAHGRLDPSLGSYQYMKWGRQLEVRVFPMQVDELLNSWEEQDSRRRRWFPVREAADQVRDPGLATLLDLFSRSV